MSLSFTSLAFVVFLALCLASLAGARSISARKWLLIACSCVFCLSFGVGGMLVVTWTALVNFIIAQRIGRATREKTRRRWLATSLAINIGLLVFFKYSPFVATIIVDLLHSWGIRASAFGGHVLSIIGLSYFTFGGISYVLDVYHEKIEPSRSLSEYVCYVIYFPKLVAGPIVRAVDFLPQLSRGLQVTARDVEVGLGYLLVGAFKKLVIADQLAGHVGMILAAPETYNAFTLVQGMVGYTVQIYADFSGYSDMAIGCARLMGIRFPQNFLMPYSSINIAEFWRRWHITLSTWFREYVFLPLEFGSRHTTNASVRTSRNIVITMLLCGLWHGASWNFVLWGGIHGLALAVYHCYATLRSRNALGPGSSFQVGTLLSRGLTLLVVMMGWVFFGTQTVGSAFKYLSRMFSWRSDGVALGSPYIIPITAVVFVAHLLIQKDRDLIEEMATRSPTVRALAYASLLFTLSCVVSSDSMPFAYVRF